MREAQVDASGERCGRLHRVPERRTEHMENSTIVICPPAAPPPAPPPDWARDVPLGVWILMGTSVLFGLVSTVGFLLLARRVYTGHRIQLPASDTHRALAKLERQLAARGM